MGFCYIRTTFLLSTLPSLFQKSNDINGLFPLKPHVRYTPSLYKAFLCMLQALLNPSTFGFNLKPQPTISKPFSSFLMNFPSFPLLLIKALKFYLNIIPLYWYFDHQKNTWWLKLWEIRYMRGILFLSFQFFYSRTIKLDVFRKAFSKIK